jgi:iron complex transport system permease protein
MNEKQTNYGRMMAVLVTAALAAVLLGLSLGSEPLTLGQVVRGVLRVDWNAKESLILWVVRLPRVAGCALAGCALAVSGLLLQTATGNPLAGPNVIGVNAGAGFAMVLGMCFAPMAFALHGLMAFFGALACAALILLLAGRVGGGRVTVVLAGVAVSALLNAGISLLKLMYPDLAPAYNYFSVGGISGITFPELALPALTVLTVIGAAAVLARRLDLLCLGDPLAAGLGVRVKLLRAVALLLASASAAAAVSFAGLLGFVGLMVPHMVRAFLKCNTVGKQLPACALLGAALVILADLLGRVLFAPSEVPAGIVTAMLGAPFFFGLLLQRRNRL